MANIIDEAEMKVKGCLLEKTVDQAFRNYKSVIVSAKDKECMRQFMKDVYTENGQEMYADFYYHVLASEDQLRFYQGLNEEEKEMLACFGKDIQKVYYKIDEKELDFLFEISAREWLFSTFYTIYKKVMIWGNYHLEFPIFCESEKDLEFYIDLAKKCGMEWH